MSITRSVLAGLFLVSSSDAVASGSIELGEFIRGADEQLAYFGGTIAVDGEWVVVGAPGKPGLRRRSYNGYISIYRLSGSGLQFVQEFRGESYEFGRFIAIEDGLLLASGSNRDGFGFGEVRSYALTEGEWREEGVLDVGTDAVAMIEGKAIVSDSLGLPVIYSLKRVDDEWVVESEIRPDPFEVERSFGDVLATDGKWIAVGAPDEGVVRFFQQEVPSADWTLQSILPDSIGSVSEMHFSGGQFFVYDGFYAGADGRAPAKGGIYVYEPDGTNWVRVQVLEPGPPDIELKTGLGRGLDIDRDRLVAGHVRGLYVFHRNGRIWDRGEEFYNSLWVGFGASVAWAGSRGLGVLAGRPRRPEWARRRTCVSRRSSLGRRRIRSRRRDCISRWRLRGSAGRCGRSPAPDSG